MSLGFKARTFFRAIWTLSHRGWSHRERGAAGLFPRTWPNPPPSASSRRIPTSRGRYLCNLLWPSRLEPRTSWTSTPREWLPHWL